jgi:hypothetical protein
MTKFEFLKIFSDFRVQPIKQLVLNSNKNIDQSAATTSVRVTPQQRLVPIIRSSMDGINRMVSTKVDTAPDHTLPPQLPRR